MRNTQAKDLMTSHPVMVSPQTTLKDAAEMMRDMECGILPVGTEDRIKGIITDRDIVIRAVARGKDPARELVGDYMTDEVHSCNESDSLEEVADKMRDHQVSRLTVMDRSGAVTGILTFGAILRKNTDADEVARVVKHATRVRAA